LIRGTLIVASVVALLGLAWIAAEWARMNFVPSPSPPEVPADAFVQHPGYESMAANAIGAFTEMPASRRETLIGNLRANLGDLNEELTRLDAARWAILCIGESHLAATRTFLAGTMLPTMALDVLLLEVSSDEFPEIKRQIDAGLAEVPLLGVDIAAIVRTALRTNPAVVVAGIDEDTSQKAQRVHRKQGSRDLSIARNLRSQFRRGKRHAVLFGALHCADQPNWLYRRIVTAESRVSREEIRNINVIGEHEDGNVEAFLTFIDAVGIERRQFMVADTGALDGLVYSWFPALTRSFLRFDSVIVFQEHAHTHSRHTPGSLE